MFDTPTYFMDALFIPYIRSNNDMNHVLSSEEASKCAAIFCHADISGTVASAIYESIG